MHRIIIAFLLLCTLSTAKAANVHAHVYGYANYPKINYGTGAQAELIKKGEYLVKAGDCIACHTAEDSKDKPFAGGLGVRTPFGTVYSENITPDKKTGLGTWTEHDFIKAMQKGISPNGSYYYPVFPFTHFTRVNEEDLKAIWAYLKVIPPIERANRTVEMPWPFSWRFSLLGWRILFFQFNQGIFQPDPNHSQEWNRGAYLVKGLGHCSMCHTPINFLGGEKHKYYLKGGFVDGFHAPDISRSALKTVPIDKIVEVFKQDHMIEGGRVVGPMAQVNHDSLKYMTDSDLRAIATYLKTVKSTPLPKRKETGSASLSEGKKIYGQYCAACHNVGAGGAPKFKDKTAWEPLLKLGQNTLVKNAIKGYKGMPPKGTCSTCSNTDIQSAVLYILKESTGKSGVARKANIILPGTSLAEGKKAYDKYCSVCHDKGAMNSPKLGDKPVWKPILRKNLDTLFTHSIKQYKNLCNNCSDTELIAAVKYMAEQSKSQGDYSEW